MKNFRVRPMSVVGSYPNDDLIIGQDILLRSGANIFSVVENDLIDNSKVTEVSTELDNWTLNEIRFFASLYIGNGPHASCRPYPLPIYIDQDAQDIEDFVSDSVGFFELLEKARSGDYFMKANLGHLPSSTSQHETIQWTELEREQSNLLWSCFDKEAHVIIRGLYALLKSQNLSEHYQFQNQALAEIHIAIDACKYVIFEKLKSMSIENPSLIDAEKFLADRFDEKFTGRGIFADYYEDRIRYFHVGNRFSDEAIPSYCVDDIWFPKRDLKEIFFSLITDQKLEAVE